MIYLKSKTIKQLSHCTGSKIIYKDSKLGVGKEMEKEKAAELAWGLPRLVSINNLTNVTNTTVIFFRMVH